ncbi:ATP-dependent Zn protease [Mycena rebaudengoi]|nr:ATP-dependent Zn protease [Mycena rebaudengoi]
MTSPNADDFVNIWADGDEKNSGDFYHKWSEQASAKHASPALTANNALRKIYGPSYSMVMCNQNILDFPAVLSSPLPNAPLVTNTHFLSRSRNGLGKVTGVLVDQIEFGAFQAAWDKYDFIVYVVSWTLGYSVTTQFFILHEGPEDPSRSLVLNAGIWAQNLHDEIWVFNQGFWQKDHSLWVEIQKADWKDVILKDEFKQALHKDVYGFFKSEAIYKELAIPWKRGLIMHGPPGNGKTISIKAIMKTCDALGFAPLYVKSFQSWMGEEGAMQEVFDKARQLSPCVVVLEDLDALINDRNRSFFLNQLDGLQGNDGLLVIGTTNHFDRLDPGLSTRPSRFDRKYLFDDPDRDERFLYAKYWQDKLESNKKITFPDTLLNEVADQTAQFSFAYLKEVFVSSLVTLAGFEGDEKDKPSFADTLMAQIKILRKQLDKSSFSKSASGSAADDSEPKRDFRPLFDLLSDPDNARPTRQFGSYPQPPPSSAYPGEQRRDFRALLDRIALQNHIISRGASSGVQNAEEGREFRALLDRVSERSDAMLAERLFQFGQTQGAYAVPAAPSAWDSPMSMYKDASSTQTQKSLWP